MGLTPLQEWDLCGAELQQALQAETHAQERIDQARRQEARAAARLIVASGWLAQVHWRLDYHLATLLTFTAVEPWDHPVWQELKRLWRQGGQPWTRQLAPGVQLRERNWGFSLAVGEGVSDPFDPDSVTVAMPVALANFEPLNIYVQLGALPDQVAQARQQLVREEAALALVRRQLAARLAPEEPAAARVE
jgi:hypothetical protein